MKVRRHYGCDTLTGAELEDQGEEGTALTHWEKRLFENEAMTGTHTQNPIYSRITMALMEDTGWYLPNYDMADELKWGRNLGCDFVLRCTIITSQFVMLYTYIMMGNCKISVIEINPFFRLLVLR